MALTIIGNHLSIFSVASSDWPSSRWDGAFNEAESKENMYLIIPSSQTSLNPFIWSFRLSLSLNFIRMIMLLESGREFLTYFRTSPDRVNFQKGATRTYRR